MENQQHEQETVFCDLDRQVQMARALKFGVQGCHQVQKKKKRRLFEILNSQFRPHR